MTAPDTEQASAASLGARRLYWRLWGPPELVRRPHFAGGRRARRNPAAAARRRARTEAPRVSRAIAVGYRYELGDAATIAGFENGRALARAGSAP